MSVRSNPNREGEAPAEPDGDGCELPEGWASGRLDSIAELNPRHPSALDDSQLVTFVPMTCVSESSPDFDRSNERPLAEIRKGYTHFADGDVLFAKITPCMENGKGAVATGLKNGLGCGTTELHVIRPLGGIDSHYVYRFLQQESVSPLGVRSSAMPSDAWFIQTKAQIGCQEMGAITMDTQSLRSAEISHPSDVFLRN